MFLITVKYRPSRSKAKCNAQGAVYYQICGQKNSEGHRPERYVNSGIRGGDEGVIKLERSKIVERLRLLYCIIERHEDSTAPFTLDDIVGDFRKAMAGDESMRGVIEKSHQEFPLRKDIVSIGREFKTSFSFIFNEKNEIDPESVSDFVFNQSQLLKNEKRLNRARAYISTMSNLRDFRSGTKLTFKQINAVFIKDYAMWLKSTGISDSTQSFYLRTLRSILNQAFEKGIIANPGNWFREVNTRIDITGKTTIEKALDRSTILKIEHADLGNDKNMELARDMFMFGFYCRGMELVDIAHLTHANIHDGYLVYHRRLKGKERRVRLSEQAQKILMRYQGSSPKYLFPLIDDSKAVLFPTISNTVSQNIKAIGRKIGHPKLSFSMNIGTWKVLMSEIDVSDYLLAVAY